MRISLGYPTPDEELAIVRDQQHGHPLASLRPVVTTAQVRSLQRAVEDVYVDDVMVNELLLGELLTNSRRIGVLTIDLGDRHHDRNLSDARVTDRLDGLRHHTVIGRNNEDRDVGDVRAA